MSTLGSIEKSLEGVFKDLPALPKGAKDWLVKAWPWLALIFGILQLAAAWALWGLIRAADTVIDSANTLSLYYTGNDIAYSSMDKTFIYLGVAVLVVDAVILLMAYPHLKNHAKKGWDLLFLGSLINVAYSVVNIFIDGRGIGSFIFSLIGSAIGFYFLYQIRDRYKTSA